MFQSVERVPKNDEHFQLLREAQIRPKDIVSSADIDPSVDIPRSVVEWTYSINITSLDNSRIDFARDFDIVECFREYRQQVQKNLQKHLLQQFPVYRGGAAFTCSYRLLLGWFQNRKNE